jgi:hypothetical protein
MGGIGLNQAAKDLEAVWSDTHFKMRVSRTFCCEACRNMRQIAKKACFSTVRTDIAALLLFVRQFGLCKHRFPGYLGRGAARFQGAKSVRAVSNGEWVGRGCGRLSRSADTRLNMRAVAPGLAQ